MRTEKKIVDIKLLVLLVLLITVINVALNAQSNGDYRSKLSGNWGQNNIWEKYDNGKWSQTLSIPGDDATVIVNHNVVSNGTNLVGMNLTISPSAILTISAKDAIILKSNVLCNGTLTVYGYIDFGTYTVTGSTASSFILASNASMVTGHKYGIGFAVANAGSVLTNKRTFDQNARYDYNGTGNQITGNALPVNIKNSVKISNIYGIVTLSQDLNIWPNANFTVLPEAILDFKNFKITGKGTTTLMAQSGLITAHADGVAFHGPFGSIQTTFRFINTDVDFTFNFQGEVDNKLPLYSSLTGDIIIAKGTTMAWEGVNIMYPGKMDVYGTLNMKTPEHTIEGSGAFYLNDNASLIISHKDGISDSGIIGAIITETRAFSSSASYTYIGVDAQVTGTGLPSTIKNLTIINAKGISILSDLSVTGSLNLIVGTMDICGKKLKLTGNKPINAQNGHITVNTNTSFAFGELNNTSGLRITLPNDLFTNTTLQIKDLTVERANGVSWNNQTLEVLGNLNLIEGPLNNSAGTLIINGTTQFTTNGYLESNGMMKLEITGTGNKIELPSLSGSLKSFSLNRTKGVQLNSQMIVNNSFIFVNGCLHTGKYNVDLNTAQYFSGYSATCHFIMDSSISSTGSVSQYVSSTKPAIYPIGNGNNYNPISVNNNGNADVYTVKLSHGIYDRGLYGELRAEAPLCVNKTWSITEDLIGGSDLTIKLYWNKDQEGSKYDRTQSNLIKWNGTDWKKDTISKFTTESNGQLSISSSNITQVGEFSIQGGNLLKAKQILTSITATTGSQPKLNISTYPNPCNNILNLNIIGNKDELVQVNMYNMQGQMVYVNQLHLVAGLQTSTIPTDAIAPGQYIVRVSSTSFVSSHYVSKQ